MTDAGGVEGVAEVQDDGLLDGDDVFVTPDDDDGGDGRAVCAEQGSEGDLAEGSDPPADGATTGQHTGQQDPGPAPPRARQRRETKYPEPGARLLYVSVDVEHSQANKFLGEIFQMAATPFAVEVVRVGSAGMPSGSDLLVLDTENSWSSFVKPSLEFGSSNFSFQVAEVSGCSIVGQSSASVVLRCQLGSWTCRSLGSDERTPR